MHEDCAQSAVGDTKPHEILTTAAFESQQHLLIHCSMPLQTADVVRLWRTSSTQTCTKLEPQRHVLFHGNMPLQNAAVARAWGTSSEVHLSKFTFSR